MQYRQYSEASEIAHSLLVYPWHQNTMEDAILTVSRYYGTPEDVGFTKHALFSEALFNQRRITARRLDQDPTWVERLMVVFRGLGQQAIKS
jgi:hypothetical protein